MEWLKTIVGQFSRNPAQHPGWIYLLAFVFWVLKSVGVPTHFGTNAASITLPLLSIEVWAVLLILAIYQLGEGLDKLTFKKRVGETWEDRYTPGDAIKAARDKFGVHEGIYKLSLEILQVNYSFRSFLKVHVLNEISKIVRSLIIPTLIFFICVTLKRLESPIYRITIVFEISVAFIFSVYFYLESREFSGSC